MKTLLSTLLLSLNLAAGLFAQGKIEGAFGQKLGAIFEPGDATPELVENVERYRFTPVAPFKGFVDYFVDVSPTSHRICAIYARSAAADWEAMDRLVTVLDVILHEKYADDPPPTEPSGIGNRVIIPPSLNARSRGTIDQRESGRSVHVGSGSPSVPRIPGVNSPNQSQSQYVVDLYYRDEAAYAEAVKEAEEIKKQKDAIWAAKQAVRDQAAKEKKEKEQAEEEKYRAEKRAKAKEEAKALDASGL